MKTKEMILTPFLALSLFVPCFAQTTVVSKKANGLTIYGLPALSQVQPQKQHKGTMYEGTGFDWFSVVSPSYSLSNRKLGVHGQFSVDWQQFDHANTVVDVNIYVLKDPAQRHTPEQGYDGSFFEWEQFTDMPVFAKTYALDDVKDPNGGITTPLFHITLEAQSNQPNWDNSNLSFINNRYRGEIVVRNIVTGEVIANTRLFKEKDFSGLAEYEFSKSQFFYYPYMEGLLNRNEYYALGKTDLYLIYVKPTTFAKLESAGKFANSLYNYYNLHTIQDYIDDIGAEEIVNIETVNNTNSEEFIHVGANTTPCVFGVYVYNGTYTDENGTYSKNKWSDISSVAAFVNDDNVNVCWVGAPRGVNNAQTSKDSLIKQIEQNVYTALEDAKLEAFDMLGRKVSDNGDLRSLSNAMYILRAVSEKKVEIKKVVKQ
jgi:hypothetical protein